MAHIEYSDKVALITGATGGIGCAIVKHLIDLFNMKIFIVTSPASETKAMQMMDEYPNHIKGYVCADMIEDSAADTIINEIKSKISSDSLHEDIKSKMPNILINCAGISKDALFISVSDDMWYQHMQINLNATWKLTKVMLRHMLTNQWGRVISISSIVGRVGNVGQVAYAASKAAIDGMTRSLSLEVAHKGITVNSIMPGFIDSDMTAFLQKDNKKHIMESILNRIPMKRIGQPKDVAIAVDYLIRSEYVTGTSLEVSGGMCRV